MSDIEPAAEPEQTGDPVEAAAPLPSDGADLVPAHWADSEPDDEASHAPCSEACSTPEHAPDAGQDAANTEPDAAPSAAANTAPSAEPASAPAKPAAPGFAELGLAPELVAVLTKKGYATPSPIQVRAIPVLLAGRDLYGQAQTGTGKTAAFGLPLLSRIDRSQRRPQALVLTPTRELALQVASALQDYAKGLPGIVVHAVYGGQGYAEQLRALKRGVHVIVGTPGRVMDHIKRGALDLSQLSQLVLDEADEMLRMGFIDDVTWLLEQTPATRQTALFSATLPAAVRRIAQTSLRDPETITIEGGSRTAATIDQRYWVVRGMAKLDALTRILEAEEHDGVLVFVRTKIETVKLSENLEARGFKAAALNGDIPQPQRERTVERFKKGHLDLLVATDVAARGLDVDRVSLVVNYDMPFDTEAYIHRIGRTGRMGRQGHAILFSEARDRRKFHAIERAVGAPLEAMQLPSVADVNLRRVERFKARITKTVEGQDLEFFTKLISEYAEETGTDLLAAAAALARLAQNGRPLLLKEAPRPAPAASTPYAQRGWSRDGRSGGAGRPQGAGRSAGAGGPGGAKRPGGYAGRGGPAEFRPRPSRPPEAGMRRYRVEVGAVHGVKPGQLVGAIANEGGLQGHQVGRIEIQRLHTTVDLPDDLGKDVLQKLAKTRVCSRPIRLAVDRTGAGARSDTQKG